jgi:hypothetical protein
MRVFNFFRSFGFLQKKNDGDTVIYKLVKSLVKFIFLTIALGICDNIEFYTPKKRVLKSNYFYLIMFINHFVLQKNPNKRKTTISSAITGDELRRFIAIPWAKKLDVKAPDKRKK